MAEYLFTACNVLVAPAWLLLIVAPRWKWTTSLITPVLVPFTLGVVYIALVASNLDPASGSFLHLEGVAGLFENRYFLLAGWVHYLAFDLFVGRWQVMDAARSRVHHVLVVPCLILTFLFGPTGLVCYLVIRWCVTRRLLVEE